MKLDISEFLSAKSSGFVVSSTFPSDGDDGKVAQEKVGGGVEGRGPDSFGIGDVDKAAVALRIALAASGATIESVPDEGCSCLSCFLAFLLEEGDLEGGVTDLVEISSLIEFCEI